MKKLPDLRLYRFVPLCLMALAAAGNQRRIIRTRQSHQGLGFTS